MSVRVDEISIERGLYRVWLGLPIERYAPCRRDHLACFDCFAQPRRRCRCR